MSANLFNAYPVENPDRVYGEVYEYEGIYWAEVVLVEDGVDWVTEKSRDFSSREKAVAWLAERDLHFPKPLSEKLADYAQTAWAKVREVVGVRPHRHAKAV